MDLMHNFVVAFVQVSVINVYITATSKKSMKVIYKLIDLSLMSLFATDCNIS